MKKQYTAEFEKVENYDKALKDDFKGWDCHHRLETHNSDGDERLVQLTAKELIALDMYYDRPPSELLYIKHGEHTTLHCKGKLIGPHSEEHKEKISKSTSEAMLRYWEKNKSKKVFYKCIETGVTKSCHEWIKEKLYPNHKCSKGLHFIKIE